MTSDIGRFDLLNTLKILLVGLALVKICDIIFNFLVDNIFPRCGCFPVLKSEEYKNARYNDVGDNRQQIEDRKDDLRNNIYQREDLFEMNQLNRTTF